MLTQHTSIGPASDMSFSRSLSYKRRGRLLTSSVRDVDDSPGLVSTMLDFRALTGGRPVGEEYAYIYP